jgi:phosphatidylglycerophosphate synthase
MECIKRLITQGRRRGPRTFIRENIHNIPNYLTFARIALTPAIGYMIVHQQHYAALGLLGIAGITDLLDGYIARRFNQKTSLGSTLDPLADKLLMTTLTVALCQSGALPLALGGLIIGRDVLLVMGTAYYRYISLPAPVIDLQEMCVCVAHDILIRKQCRDSLMPLCPLCK